MDGKGKKKVHKTSLYVLVATLNQHFIFLCLIFFKNRVFNGQKTFWTPEDK